MEENILVSGYYVDDGPISIPKANHEIFRGHIIGCTKEELNEMRKNQLHEDDPPMKEQMNPT